MVPSALSANSTVFPKWNNHFHLESNRITEIILFLERPLLGKRLCYLKFRDSLISLYQSFSLQANAGCLKH